jgi:hypothetical protein
MQKEFYQITGKTDSRKMAEFLSKDGLVEVEAAFDRGAFSLCSSGQAERSVSILGLLTGTSGQYFYGTDSIKIINKMWEHLAGLASHWPEAGCGEPDWCGGAGLNQDSVVNLLDFALFDGCCIEIITE